MLNPLISFPRCEASEAKRRKAKLKLKKMIKYKGRIPSKTAYILWKSASRVHYCAGWKSPLVVLPLKCSCRLKIEVCMIKVKSRGNETAEQMLRRFKKMCEKEGLTKDIKRVAYYEKPSEKRRRRQRKGPRPTSMSGGGG